MCAVRGILSDRFHVGRGEFIASTGRGEFVSWRNSRIARISTASVFAGFFVGLVGGAFRHFLIAADAWPYAGLLAPVSRWDFWAQPQRASWWSSLRPQQKTAGSNV